MMIPTTTHFGMDSHSTLFDGMKVWISEWVNSLFRSFAVECLCRCIVAEGLCWLPIGETPDDWLVLLEFQVYGKGVRNVNRHT